MSTILAGSVIGISIGSRLPERLRVTVLHGLGLVTLLVGMQMALETKNIMIVLGAILLGGLVGELVHLHDGLEWLGDRLQTTVARWAQGSRHETLGEGFVTASLIFCVGPMAILGSVQDGLTGDTKLLAVKSILDGFASIAFAASLGWGVSLSSLSIFAYQGSITILAGLLDRILTAPMITEMTATGGLIIVGISLKLLDVKSIRLASFLPALAVAPLLVVAVQWVKSL